MRRLGLLACAAAALLALLASPARAQIDPRTAFLEKAGWDALAAGQAHAAADDFRQGLVADPKNARLLLGAGIAAFLERRDTDATDALEHALAIDPKAAQARQVLGQTLYRLGDLNGAVRTYEQLVAGAPDDTAARSTLERWRREVELHDRMQQAIGDHFTVSFEGPGEAALADEALASLDRAYGRICSLLGVFPTQPIAVVLYSTEQFRDITRAPSWAAGSYDTAIRVPMRGALANLAELDRVMAHELTHAVVRTLATRGVPTWLNEGLATALESGDLMWAEQQVQTSGPVPLLALQSGFSGLTGNQAQLAYATSALAVRTLIEDAGGLAVANLLRDLGAGVDFNAAFLHRIQRPFADFQAGPFQVSYTGRQL